ncbi:kinase-like domain-containing protein [Suillus americanus]|nr:kinase-like domain-containing protein [Suillus americanus]
MGNNPSASRGPRRLTQIIDSVDNTAASADSAIRPLTRPVVQVPVCSITIDAPQVQASNTVHENLVPCAVTVLQPVTHGTHEAQPVAFDADPFSIPSTSIKKQTDYPTSSGSLGDIWKCSMTTDLATSTEVAVKSIRIVDIRNEEAIQNAKKRLRREVARWIKLRHAHVLTLYGTVSGFGQLPALVSTWMHNGALDGYLERTSLTMEQKLKLLKQVVDGLRYLHEQEVIHGDLTSTNVVIDRDGNAFLTDFGLSVALAENDRTYYNSYSSGAVRWLAPELIGSREPESNPDNSDSDAELPKPNSQSDVFSLGCIMLHVFSGRPPFWWLRNVQQIFSAQLKRVEPYRVEPSVTISHQHLDFMRRCWSAKPDNRPSIGDATSFVDYELRRASGAMTILQPVTPDTHEAPSLSVAFDADPFAIPSTSIRKQTNYPTSSGGLGDIWKCSMTTDLATSTEVAVKTIRITDILNKEAVQKAKKRLRHEVAVWIKLRHAHVLALYGTASGFGPLPALVSIWMHNGALDGYLKRTSLTMEQKLKLVKFIMPNLSPYSIDALFS